MHGCRVSSSPPLTPPLPPLLLPPSGVTTTLEGRRPLPACGSPPSNPAPLAARSIRAPSASDRSPQSPRRSAPSHIFGPSPRPLQAPPRLGGSSTPMPRPGGGPKSSPGGPGGPPRPIMGCPIGGPGSPMPSPRGKPSRKNPGPPRIGPGRPGGCRPSIPGTRPIIPFACAWIISWKGSGPGGPGGPGRPAKPPPRPPRIPCGGGPGGPSGPHMGPSGPQSGFPGGPLPPIPKRFAGCAL
eukprot:1190005-Prorocentrum_minimum.AAC.3